MPAIDYMQAAASALKTACSQIINLQFGRLTAGIINPNLKGTPEDRQIEVMMVMMKMMAMIVMTIILGTQ